MLGQGDPTRLFTDGIQIGSLYMLLSGSSSYAGISASAICPCVWMQGTTLIGVGLTLLGGLLAQLFVQPLLVLRRRARQEMAVCQDE